MEKILSSKYTSYIAYLEDAVLSFYLFLASRNSLNVL